jgi:hypothetical protein
MWASSDSEQTYKGCYMSDQSACPSLALRFRGGEKKLESGKLVALFPSCALYRRQRQVLSLFQTKSLFSRPEDAVQEGADFLDGNKYWIIVLLLIGARFPFV